MGLIKRLASQLFRHPPPRERTGDVNGDDSVLDAHRALLEAVRLAWQAGNIAEATIRLEVLERENTVIGEAWFLIGQMVRIGSSTDESNVRALTCYARARQRGFDSPDLSIAIAATYLDQFRIEEAMRELLHVRAQATDSPLWHFHFGRAREMEHEFAAAHEAFSTALELAPGLLPARKARAQVLTWMGKFDACRSAIRDLSQYGVSDLDIAREFTMVAWVMGDLDLHEQSARSILAREPHDAGALLSLGNVLMTRGNFKEGWCMMEARLRHPGYPHFQPVLPRWNGEDLTGKHLWIYEEQGFGDEIMFARFLPRIVAKAGRVTLQCKPPLERLFANLPGLTLVPFQGRLPVQEMRADYELPLMSLPAMLGLDDLGSIREAATFALPPTIPDVWRDRVAAQLGSKPRRLRVGLAVSGRPQRKDNLLRSVAVDTFAPLSCLDADFFWVQPDLEPTSASAACPAVIDFTAELTDFAETAGLLGQLDLVISIDTAVAHLAASLGIETWVLLPCMRDWRWDIEGHGCIWYDSVRTWRVSPDHNWRAAVDDVTTSLRDRISSHSQAGR